VPPAGAARPARPGRLPEPPAPGRRLHRPFPGRLRRPSPRPSARL